MTFNIRMPDQILNDLGITAPDQIDLVRIALSLGVKIKDRRLDGCEARIVGEGNRAIISIDDRVSSRRRRFSIGHELGHWMCHRGQCLACPKESIGQGPSTSNAAEKIADRFAAQLLMPSAMIKNISKRNNGISLHTINDVVESFDVSRSAAALRIVEMDLEPCILLRHSKRGSLPWRVTSKSVDRKWYPRLRVDQSSHACDILYHNAGDQVEGVLSSAEDWFDQDGADQYEVLEQSFRSVEGEVFTLIKIIDEKMMAD